MERFFARYRAAEAEALLDRSGFTVDLRQHGADGGRSWLRFLALTRPETVPRTPAVRAPTA